MKHPPRYSVCDQIVELRRASGLSQAGFGALVGMSSAAVSQWETGATEPKLSTFIALIKELRGRDAAACGEVDKTLSSIFDDWKRLKKRRAY